MVSTYTEAHIGHLPIRVLQYNIVHQFENTSSDFPRLSNEVINHLGLKKEIDYHTNQSEHKGEPIKGPCVDIKEKRIQLQETFLAYLWCMCYVLLGYTNKLIAQEDSGNIDSTTDMSERILNYALSLVKEYKNWDKAELINPEEYSLSDKREVEKVNEIFLYATNFALCHEFSHVERKHAHQKESDKYISELEECEFEIEADKRAIELMQKGMTNSSKKSLELGVTMGVCAILFLRDTVKNRIHPDNDVRIANVIELLDIDENDHPWIIACAALNLWSNIFDLKFNWEEKENFKALFYFISHQIEY